MLEDNKKSVKTENATKLFGYLMMVMEGRQEIVYEAGKNKVQKKALHV